MLLGGDGSDWLSGEEGDDTSEGGAGADHLAGGAGADRMRGDGGDDTLLGEAGNDELDGGDGNDALDGGVGHDVLMGAGGNDTLRGGAGNDGLGGSDGDDILDGEDGDDILKGGAGLDLLSGGTGHDTLHGGADADTISGASGDDHAYGDDGDDTLEGDAGADKLWGGNGADTLNGGQGDDMLTGDGGNDSLIGGLGADMLAGGRGADTLDGGGGNDQLLGSDGNDILFGGPDVDYIDGGAGTDTIVLTGRRLDCQIRFNTAVGRFSIVDLRAGSPDGTDLADIEIFRFSDGEITKAALNYLTGSDRNIAWGVANSDGSKSTLGWRPWVQEPTQLEAYVQHRNIVGTLMSETVFHPDGSRLAYAWEVENDPNIKWASYVQTYDAQASLIKEQRDNKDGTQTIDEWDQVNEDWDQRTTHLINVNGNFEARRQVDTLDDGKGGIVDYIEREMDPADAYTWISIVREYDQYTKRDDLSGSNEHWLIEDTYFDVGEPISRIRKGKDYYQADGQNHGSARPAEWKEFEERYSGSIIGWERYLYYTYVHRFLSNVALTNVAIQTEQDMTGSADWSSIEYAYTEEAPNVVAPHWRETIYDTNSLYSKREEVWQYVATDWRYHVTNYAKNDPTRKLDEEFVWMNGDVIVKGYHQQWAIAPEIDWTVTHYDGANEVTNLVEILYTSGRFVEVDYVVDSHPEYYTLTTIYSDNTRADTLEEHIMLDSAETNGVIYKVTQLDPFGDDNRWNKIETGYKINPDTTSSKRYLPVYQDVEATLDYIVRIERDWDYTAKNKWEYTSIAKDSRGRVNFEGILSDDKTYKTTHTTTRA